MSSRDLPTLSSSQVKAVDALCEERFGIPTEWLMEAAGWHVATFVRETAVVVCGVGNNAGDGLAAARHLHRWGRLARVCCVDPSKLRGMAARQLEALRKSGVEPSAELRLDGADTVVDAIFGTGLSRAPEGKFGDWIRAINQSRARIVSIDVPSGLDAETGVAYSPVVKAAVTVTLGLPKRGLTGKVMVADIGVPPAAYAAIGIEAPADLFHGTIRPL